MMNGNMKLFAEICFVLQKCAPFRSPEMALPKDEHRCDQQHPLAHVDLGMLRTAIEEKQLLRLQTSCAASIIMANETFLHCARSQCNRPPIRISTHAAAARAVEHRVVGL